MNYVFSGSPGQRLQDGVRAAAALFREPGAPLVGREQLWVRHRQQQEVQQRLRGANRASRPLGGGGGGAEEVQRAISATDFGQSRVVSA